MVTDPTPNTNNALNPEEIWWDNADIKKYFPFSDRSLQRMRSSGELVYYKPNNKVIYKRSEFLAMIENRKVNKGRRKK